MSDDLELSVGQKLMDRISELEADIERLQVKVAYAAAIVSGDAGWQSSELAERAEAVAAALRSLVAEGTLEYTGRIEAENERLRAMLRDVRDLGINAPIEDRIDAALKEKP